MTCTPNVFSIFRGDDKVLALKAVYADSGDPLDLTSCTEIDVAISKDDGTFEHYLLSEDQVEIIPPDLLGKFEVPISSLQSTDFNPGERQNVDVTFTIASRVFTVRYLQALSVFERG